MSEWMAELIVGGALLVTGGVGYLVKFQSGVSKTVAKADATVQSVDHQMDLMMQEQVASREKMDSNLTDLRNRIDEVKDEVHEVKADVAFIKGHLDH